MSPTSGSNPVLVKKKRWAAYAAAGVAATFAGTQSAEADITHVVVGSPAGDWTTDDDLYFPLAGDASLNFYHPGYGAGIAIFNGGYFGTIVGQTIATVFRYASNLASGANISTQNFLTAPAFAILASYSGATYSQFVNTSGIIGFRFDGGAGTQYGWARVTALGDAPINSYVIEEYAYADVGESIAAGQIPEPSSLGLLALGAVGILAGRRRRKDTA